MSFACHLQSQTASHGLNVPLAHGGILSPRMDHILGVSCTYFRMSPQPAADANEMMLQLYDKSRLGPYNQA